MVVVPVSFSGFHPPPPCHQFANIRTGHDIWTKHSWPQTQPRLPHNCRAEGAGRATSLCHLHDQQHDCRAYALQSQLHRPDVPCKSPANGTSRCTELIRRMTPACPERATASCAATDRVHCLQALHACGQLPHKGIVQCVCACCKQLAAFSKEALSFLAGWLCACCSCLQCTT